MSELRDKTISGLFWSFIEKIGGRGIEALITILLARILTPRDFGLVGMLAIFIALSQALVQAGFSQALIQKKDTDEEEYSSVFYINLTFSLLLYLLLFFTAPLIADFYQQPILVSMTRVLSVIFVINAFSYVQEAKLKKELKFKSLTFVHLPSILISGIIAIIMAYKGFGVWSIVAQRVVMRFAYAVQIWIYSKWIPQWTFNKKKAKGLFSFGSNLMISGIIHSVYDNVYLIIIGKFFPINILGYYQYAKKLVDFPIKNLGSVVNSVSFPALSSIQEDNKRLKDGYKKIIQHLFFISTPILIFSAILAKPLFGFVLTDKWLPAVPFFQLLCIWGLFYPLNTFNIEIINVKGRSDFTLKLQVIKKIVVTIGIIATIPFGIWPLVIFQTINGLLAYFINSYYSGRFIDYTMKEQVKDVLPIFLIGLLFGGILFLLNFIFAIYPRWIRVIFGYLIGGIGYLTFSWKIRLAPAIELYEIWKEKMMQRNK